MMFREIARYLGQGVNAAAPTGKETFVSCVIVAGPKYDGCNS